MTLNSDHSRRPNEIALASWLIYVNLLGCFALDVYELNAGIFSAPQMILAWFLYVPIALLTIGFYKRKRVARTLFCWYFGLNILLVLGILGVIFSGVSSLPIVSVPRWIAGVISGFLEIWTLVLLFSSNSTAWLKYR